MTIKDLTIKDGINSYYRKYAFYVLESRGIPNFYDSLTPVQRLVLLNAPEKLTGTLGLVGAVFQTGLYHHGDMGLTKAIHKLARPFGCSERLLIGDGFLGSPVKPEPSSPRYTKVRVSPFVTESIKQYYPLNAKNTEGGIDWLHVDLPIGLCTHIVGIAVGYSSNILPRKMSDVREYLDGKNKVLKPHFADFNGTVKKHPTMKKTWIIQGEFEVDDRSMTIKIGDLPPLMRFDNFLKKLYSKMEELGDDGKVDNDSSKRVNLTIRWKNKDTWEELKETVSNMTAIGAIESLIFVKDGSIVEYEDFADYLDEFRIHRERVFYKKMLYDADMTSDELDFLRAKVLFLGYMMEKKRKADEVKAWLKPYKTKTRARLENIKLTALTAEEVKATNELIKETEKTLAAEKAAAKKQHEKCAKMEKEFVGKGKVNVGARKLFADELPVSIDGIEVYSAEAENEDEHDERGDSEGGQEE
jgi:DNA gyrase/topoisomerase IV subunit A